MSGKSVPNSRSISELVIWRCSIWPSTANCEDAMADRASHARAAKKSGRSHARHRSRRYQRILSLRLLLMEFAWLLWTAAREFLLHKHSLRHHPLTNVSLRRLGRLGGVAFDAYCALSMYLGRSPAIGTPSQMGSFLCGSVLSRRDTVSDRGAI